MREWGVCIRFDVVKFKKCMILISFKMKIVEMDGICKLI